MFSLGTVVAKQEDKGFGPWELFDPADTALNDVLFDVYDDQLLDLMEAGLAVVDPDGNPVARRERIRTYIPVS